MQQWCQDDASMEGRTLQEATVVSGCYPHGRKDVAGCNSGVRTIPAWMGGCCRMQLWYQDDARMDGRMLQDVAAVYGRYSQGLESRPGLMYNTAVAAFYEHGC